MVYEGITKLIGLEDDIEHSVELHINMVTIIGLQDYSPLEMEIRCQTCNLHHVDITEHEYITRRDNKGKFINYMDKDTDFGTQRIELPIVKIRLLMKRSLKIIHNAYELGCVCHSEGCKGCMYCISTEGSCPISGYRIE